MKSTLFALFLLPFTLIAQDENEEAYSKQYAFNITQEYLNDIYIPENVDDAMKQINMLSNEEGRVKLLEADENLAAERLIYGLGKWMTVNWNFYEGSRLSHHLKQFGVTHPEDMAKFLIVSYHRYLREVPLELELRGKQIKEENQKEQEKRNARKRIIEGAN